MEDNKNNGLSFEDYLHEFDIDDDDKSYEDWVKNHKTPEELMEMFPPEQPIDVKEWTKDDFRQYYNEIRKSMTADVAWEFLYAKILDRAGEGDGGVSFDENGDLTF